MYLVTKQFGSSSPNEWELCANRETAASKAVELSNMDAPANLTGRGWERIQGNQHKQTRWLYWYRTDAGSIVNIEVRKFSTVHS